MNLSPLPVQRFYDNNNVPLAGGLLFVYAPASTTKIATYTDSTGGTQNSNPIVLNYRGECNIWLDPTLTYKFVLSPANDTDPPTNPFWSVDNIAVPASISNITTVLTQQFLGQILYPRTAAEIAAGVTPFFFNIPPYYIGRYGNVGVGSNDSPIFNAAGSIGPTILVPELTGGASYLLNTTVAGMFQAIGVPRFIGAGTIGLASDVGVQRDENNSGVVGSFPETASVLMIGDSITQGTGASTYVNSNSWIIGRSLMNAANEGVFSDSGFGYHHILQMSSFVSSPGVSTTGALTAAGVWGSRLNLTGAQVLTLTLRELKALDVIYDATASAGCTFVIKLNGATISTVVVAGTGLKITAFPTILKTNGILTRLSDSITVSVTAGTLQIAGIMDVKNSAVNPCTVYIGGQSGYGYQDYTSSANMDELAFYLNNPLTATTKLFICQLGTNNMYNAGRALSPAATVAAIATLLNGMVSRCANLQLAISVPPRSNENLFPMILGFKYEDYVRAIVSYALTNNITLIRHDMGNLSTTLYYADGLHPNDVGHTLWAQTTLRTLGTKLDKYFKSVNFTLDEYLTQVRQDGVITMNSTWGPFGALAGFAARAHLVAGNLVLSGTIVPNGSVATTIGTLPAGFIPDSQDRFVTLQTNSSGGAAGTVKLSIKYTGSGTPGALVITAVPTNDVSLDGVCIPLYKFIES